MTERVRNLRVWGFRVTSLINVPKNFQNVWIMASNLRKNKLDIERLEQAIYTIDLSDLTFDMMTQILATKVKHFFPSL